MQLTTNALVGIFLLLFLRLNIGSITARFKLCIFAIAVWLIPYHWLKLLISTPLVLEVDWLGPILSSTQNLQPATTEFNLSTWLSLNNLLLSLFVIGLFIFIKQIIRYYLWLDWLKKDTNHKPEVINCQGKYYSVRLTEKIATGLITGYLKPTIWINAQLVGTPHYQLILAHEIQHIKNRDHWILLLVAFIRGIYWWNPVVQMLIRECILLIELRCDQQACASYGKQNYLKGLAELMLFSQKIKLPELINSFNGKNNSNLKRLQSLNKEQTMNSGSKLIYLTLCLCSLLILSLPFADIKGNEQTIKAVGTDNGLLLDFTINIKDRLEDGSITSRQNELSIWTAFDKTAVIILDDGFKMELKITDHGENYYLDMTLSEAVDNQPMVVVASPQILAKIGREAMISLSADDLADDLAYEIQVIAHKVTRPE